MTVRGDSSGSACATALPSLPSSTRSFTSYGGPDILDVQHMLLIDDKAAGTRGSDPRAAQQISTNASLPTTSARSSSSSEHAPLLPIFLPPPTYASVVSPVPAAPVPEAVSSDKRSRRPWTRWLVYALAAYIFLGLAAGSAASGDYEDPEDESSSSPSPPSVPRVPKTPAPPSVPSIPGVPWNSSLYLPAVSDGTPLLCNPIHGLLTTSTTRTSVMKLLVADLDLFVRFSTVRPRTRGQAPPPTPVHPNARVTFEPWFEDDEAYANWREDSVIVVVEQSRNEGEDPVDVCLMSSRYSSGVGIYSSTDRPPQFLNVTILVPTSASSQRTIDTFLIDQLSGDLTVGNFPSPSADSSLADSSSLKLWHSLDLRLRTGSVSIGSLAINTLSISADEASVALGSVLVESTLHVRTTRRGSFTGNLTLSDGSLTTIDTAEGSITANVSLVLSSASSTGATPISEDDDPFPEPPREPSEDSGSDVSSSSYGRPSIPSLPRPRPKQPPSPSPEVPPPFRVSSLTLTSANAGNISLLFPSHSPHIPLQATLAAPGGYAHLLLAPTYQGTLHLTSRLSAATSFLPHVLPDPFGFGRPFSINLFSLSTRDISGSCGVGILARPDFSDGRVEVSARDEAAVGTWGWKAQF